MKSEYKQALLKYKCDVDGALSRLAGNEDFYERLLNKFLLDPNYTNLKTCITTSNYNDAFQFAHTLKGLSGNLGLIPIYESVHPIVELLRNNKIEEVAKHFPTLELAYDDICDIIRNHA